MQEKWLMNILCICALSLSVGLMFAQFPKVPSSSEEVPDSARTDATPSTLTYTELGDGQVTDILKSHIEDLKYNKGNGIKMVLFTGAIEHVSRICRVMVSVDMQCIQMV